MMTRRRFTMSIWVWVCSLILVGVVMLPATSAAEVPRMTKEQLTARLEHTENAEEQVMLLDVRSQRQWEDSALKIQGAVWENPRKFRFWAGKYPKAATLVLYCDCQNEVTSARLGQKLLEAGYTRVYALKGGWPEWLQAGYPVEEKEE